MNKNLLKIFLALVAIIISSYISYTIPIQGGIPFTAQSLVVFVVASILSPIESLICLGIYLILGALGLPVFAEGTAGIERIMGNSGGFLYGFIFSALLISTAIKRFKVDALWKYGVLMFLATICLFFFGLMHLGLKLDFEKAFEYGLKPFWKMGMLKCFVAAGIAYLFNKFLTTSKL